MHLQIVEDPVVVVGVREVALHLHPVLQNQQHQQIGVVRLCVNRDLPRKEALIDGLRVIIIILVVTVVIVEEMEVRGREI